MKTSIQNKWNLYYDVARFLILDGGKQIDYAKLQGFHKSKVHRIVGILVKEGIIRKLVRSAYIVYGKGPNWHHCDEVETYQNRFLFSGIGSGFFGLYLIFLKLFFIVTYLS